MVTLASLGGNVIIERPKGVSLRTWYTDGADIYPGMFVTANGESTPDLCRIDASGEIPYGVAVERRDGTAQDPDTAIPDGTPFLVAPCGSGMVVQALAITSRGAIVPGDFLKCSISGHLQGTVAGKTTVNTITVAIKGYLYQNVGRATDYDADVAAWDYVKVRLCI
jgi:hypothetical protein